MMHQSTLTISIRKHANIWLPLLLILLSIAMFIANLGIQSRFSTYDDFAPRWSAARWWLNSGADPYSQETAEQSVLIQAEYQLLPNNFDQGRFVEPAFYIYFFLPVSWIDFPAARAIWMTLIEFALISTVWLAIDLVGLKLPMVEKLILSLSFLVLPPIAKSVLSASILPLFMFFLMWGCRLAMQKEGTGAGILLLLCFGIMPESILVAIFLMVVLSARKVDEFVRVYFIGILFLFLITWILLPGWVGDWFANLIRLHPDLSWINTPIIRMTSLLPDTSQYLSIGLHALLGLWLLTEWYGLGRFSERKLIWKLALTLNLVYFMNTMSRGVYLLMVLPALFSGYKFIIEKWGVFGKILIWIGYLGIVGFYLQRFTIGSDLSAFESTTVVLTLPVLSILTLQWFRWWATESPRALTDNTQ